jgi:hypothetical protein
MHRTTDSLSALVRKPSRAGPGPGPGRAGTSAAHGDLQRANRCLRRRCSTLGTLQPIRRLYVWFWQPRNIGSASGVNPDRLLEEGRTCTALFQVRDAVR